MSVSVLNSRGHDDSSDQTSDEEWSENEVDEAWQPNSKENVLETKGKGCSVPGCSGFGNTKTGGTNPPKKHYTIANCPMATPDALVINLDFDWLASVPLSQFS